MLPGVANGRSLIPGVERVLHRTLATPGVSVDVLGLFYDLLYFLYWYVAPTWEAMRAFTDPMKRFAEAVRVGTLSDLPAITPRPLGPEPLRVGYLSQFGRRGSSTVAWSDAILGGLSRCLPGSYGLVLYAWSEHDDLSMAMLADQGVTVRRFSANSMSERIAAVAEAIRADEIDILITDMNTALPTMLFELRVAPIQVFFQIQLPFWPIANIDGVLRVEFYDPALDGFERDRCFDLGLQAWNESEYAPPVAPERIAAERARFPAAPQLIGTYVRLAIITPDFLEIITDLLARHPQLVVAIGGNGDGGWIHEFIAASGLAGRLVLIDEFVDGHAWGHMLDIFLDTSYGATSAGREVMAKGKPVVCLRNPTTERERVPMLIADDRDVYRSRVAAARGQRLLRGGLRRDPRVRRGATGRAGIHRRCP
jgi:hypothetical protein